MTGETVNPALQDMARSRAGAEPLPGAMADAFLADDIQIAEGIVVRRIVASDWKILNWLNSPIKLQVLELTKPKEQREDVQISDDEEMEICFQFTRPLPEVRKAQKFGRAGFTETAYQSIGDKYDNVIIGKIKDAVTDQFLLWLKRMAELMPNASEPEKKT